MSDSLRHLVKGNSHPLITLYGPSSENGLSQSIFSRESAVLINMERMQEVVCKEFLEGKPILKEIDLKPFKLREIIGLPNPLKSRCCMSLYALILYYTTTYFIVTVVLLKLKRQLTN